MKTWEKVFKQVVAEGTTCAFTGGQFVDEQGNNLNLADLGYVKLWLYNQATPAVFINSRNGGSILNANGGVISGTGAFTLTLAPADNVLASQAVSEETHEALIEYTYNGGAAKARVILRFVVSNLLVPTS